MKLLLENWRKYLIEGTVEENPPWSDDEKRERHISHVAEKEVRQLVALETRKLKQDIGRYWGDSEKEIAAKRDVVARATAYKVYLPNLDDALAMEASDERDDRIKYVVYVLDSLQPGSYEPSEEELAGFQGDRSKAGAPQARKLSGTFRGQDIS